MSEPQNSSAFVPPVDAGTPTPPDHAEQLFDPQRPEKALAAAFTGGLLFAMLLRRVRS